MQHGKSGFRGTRKETHHIGIRHGAGADKLLPGKGLYGFISVPKQRCGFKIQPLRRFLHL